MGVSQSQNECCLFDLSNLKKMVGDQDVFMKLVRIFLDTTPAMLEGLNEGLQNRNYQNVAFFAHKMKSSIDILKIKDLDVIVRRIEENVKTNSNIDDIPSMVDKVNVGLNQVISGVKKELNI